MWLQQVVPTTLMGQTPSSGRTHAKHAQNSNDDTNLWDQHNYNANPFAPLGCKVEAHVTPGVRETWAPHTASGYNIGNTWEHYRCHEVYISDTKSMQTCLSIFFKHKYLTMPTVTPADALIRAADYLTDAI